MTLFKLTVMTPEATLFDGTVFSAVFPGYDGFFEILSQHAPIVAMVKKGTIEIVDGQKIPHSIKVEEGFFEFYHNKGVLVCLSSKKPSL